MKKLGQRGVGAIEIILLAVVIGMIGYVAWYVFDQNQKKDDSAQTDAASINEEDINDAEDLQAAEETINSTDIDEELTTSEIDEALAQ